MIYTAKLTGNRREIHTTTPKCLLTNISPDNELGREHCWVDLTDELAAASPAGHEKPRTIRFEAKIKPYLKRGVHQALTLTNIKILS